LAYDNKNNKIAFVRWVVLKETFKKCLRKKWDNLN
jgi:hypothetical protein